jgi:1,4-alpha-glucan branching enzyme
VLCDRAEEGIVAFKRRSESGELLCIMNFSPFFYSDYSVSIGKSHQFFRETLNSDAVEFGGRGRLNRGIFGAENGCFKFCIPPFSAFIFEPFYLGEASGEKR